MAFVSVVPEVGGGMALVLDVSVIETPVSVDDVEDVSVAAAAVSVLLAAVSLLHPTAPVTHVISRTPSTLRIYPSNDRSTKESPRWVKSLPPAVIVSYHQSARSGYPTAVGASSCSSMSQATGTNALMAAHFQRFEKSVVIRSRWVIEIASSKTRIGMTPSCPRTSSSRFSLIE
jgi:hypothetical protein